MNYLYNGGFEDGSSETGSDANGWLPWWEETAKPKEGYDYAYKPQWNRELLSNGAAEVLVYAGNASLRVYNSWNPWHAGVYQAVNVPVGKQLRLSAHARLWAASDGWPTPSDESVNTRVQVGMDLFGGFNAFDSNVVWSGVISPHNRWQPVSLDFQSVSPMVSVFLSTNYRGDSRQFMMSFWDEISLSPVYKTFMPIIQR